MASALLPYLNVWAVRPDDSLSDYSNFYWFTVA